MSDKYYSYDNRKGVLPVSWEDFFSICKGLALVVYKYNPNIILGVARGGLYPATQIANMLQTELYPIRITSRFKDQVIYKTPRWLVKPPPIVKGKKILIVDEICSEGKTLQIIKKEVVKLGGKDVKSAVMYAHKKGKDVPDYIGIISDAIILNPWDREIVKNGKFIFHPEYVSALKKNNIYPKKSLLLGIKSTKLTKG